MCNNDLINLAQLTSPSMSCVHQSTQYGKLSTLTSQNQYLKWKAKKKMWKAEETWKPMFIHLHQECPGASKSPFHSMSLKVTEDFLHSFWIRSHVSLWFVQISGVHVFVRSVIPSPHSCVSVEPHQCNTVMGRRNIDFIIMNNFFFLIEGLRMGYYKNWIIRTMIPLHNH